jgi:hypothetical protein
MKEAWWLTYCSGAMCPPSPTPRDDRGRENHELVQEPFDDPLGGTGDAAYARGQIMSRLMEYAETDHANPFFA